VRVLAIDYGARRLGLALSDEEGAFAFPAGALERRGLRRDVAQLAALARERGVASVVVGLPLHMDGREGPEARAARAFAAALREASGLPVDTFDERWTTREAERALAERGPGGHRARARKGELDEVAATLLLRAWLARRRAEGARAAESG